MSQDLESQNPTLKSQDFAKKILNIKVAKKIYIKLTENKKCKFTR